jgi:hypothetical protein
MGGGTSSVSINGITIEVRGGRVYVGGKLYIPAVGDAGPSEAAVPEGATLNLDRDGRIVGNIQGDLTVRGSNVKVVIEGNVDGSVKADGDVSCQRVGGSATAGGSIQTESVGGSANAGGDVRAGKIGGSANAGGNIFRG